MQGFVLIQTSRGTGPIASDLLALPGIESADDLRGPYDAIAVAVGDEHRPVEQILEGVRRVPGVTRALIARTTASDPSTGEAAA